MQALANMLCKILHGEDLNVTSRWNNALEHMAEHYVIFVMIGQFAYFAHQNCSFWWAKQTNWPSMINDKDDVMVCHMF